MATKKPTETQTRNAFITLARVNPFNVGDTVKVLRSFADNEMGCEIYPDDDVEDSVGSMLAVTDVYDTGHYELENGSSYPFFVLERIRESKCITLNDEYDAAVSEDGETVEVGCQTFQSDAILKLANVIRAARDNYTPPAKRARKRASRRR
jgi:hypothetical protein